MPELGKEIRQDRGFESLEQEVHLNLQRTASILAAPFVKKMKEAGLSASQYNILRILRGQRGQALSCRAIAERMVTRDSDITRLLDRLIKMDLVRRVRSAEDRRVVLTSINSSGMELLAKLDNPMHELHTQGLRHLSEIEKKELNRLLEKARQPLAKEEKQP